ncbi:response regulator [Sediminibacterium ginsengisoli]|uniref:histidine kinase n=1 Tax=Sediminibacterium ginsengisoli TaxID=413434 RepID=A0A1T4K246_9BACT|nr:response regulator [Sediminibacterium ginsengisoli]SJZ36458.1 His Kinase A (phospho-acceptor) domain-containing protein [Sediminibacterium ginsengisoli]
MILIVDDRPENILSLKSFLELHQFEVDTAASGEEALKKVLNTPYFLIILDVQMPGMDGFEVAEAISGYSKAKDTPIIFLSAVSTEKRFITQGYTSGGVDYVTKPFDPDILLLKVKTFYRIHVQKKALSDMQDELKKEIEIRKHAEMELNLVNQLLEQRVAERTEELKNTNEILAKKNTELQQFAYVSSHDLKEPLRKIQIFSNIIHDKYLQNNPEASDYINRIISSSSRMTTLINDILEYSRLTVKNDFRNMDINLIVNGVIADLDIFIQEKKAEITVAPFPLMMVIPVQIRQLFQNIISNALKFSRPDIAVKININAEIIAEKSFSSPAVPVEEAEYCRISISDNGIGFNELYIDKIFAIFQRLHSKDEYAGTGIGLAIVKKIVDNHNGLIQACSKPGEGAVFTIVLPLTQSITHPSSETISA